MTRPRFTKEPIQNVCNECGIQANKLTCLERYGAEPKKKKSTLSTYHNANCDFCGQWRAVTEVRDFFFPDFSLLEKYNKKLNRYIFGERQVS